MNLLPKQKQRQLRSPKTTLSWPLNFWLVLQKRLKKFFFTNHYWQWSDYLSLWRNVWHELALQLLFRELHNWSNRQQFSLKMTFHIKWEAEELVSKGKKMNNLSGRLLIPESTVTKRLKYDSKHHRQSQQIKYILLFRLSFIENLLWIRHRESYTNCRPPSLVFLMQLV